MGNLERKKSRPCFQGRDIVARGTTLVRLCFTTQAFTSTDASCVILIAEKVRMKHRYPCAVMGAPIIVSTRKMRVVGMQLQGFIRFRFRNSDCSEYLSLYPISAHGTLCNTSRYLLSLFIAFTIFTGYIIAELTKKSMSNSSWSNCFHYSTPYISIRLRRSPRLLSYCA